MDGGVVRFSRPRVAASVYFFICGLVFATWAARIPDVKDRFDLDEAQLGGLLFMLPFGSVSALPVAGWVIDRLGSRWVTAASAALYGLLLWSLSMAGSPAGLSVLLFLFGFVGDMLNISMNTQGLNVQRTMGRTILSGLHAQWSFGALAGASLAGWALKAGLSMESHFMYVAGTVFALSLFVSPWMLADPERDRASRKVYSWPDRALVLLGLICFCNTIAEGAMADWSSLYYRGVLKDGGGVSTTGYMAFTLAMALGRLAGDRLIQRLRYRRMLMLNGALVAAGLLLAILLPRPAAVITGFALVGLGVSSVIPIVYMIAGKTRTMSPAAALATVSAIGFTGFLTGPPLIGFIAHEVTLRWSLLLVAALGLVIAWVSSRAIGRDDGG